jgi:hypothetical protein
MMRWNREAAMLGIPDLPEEGFKHVGDRKIKPQGGGGSGGGHTTSTVTQKSDNVPEYAQSQFLDILGRGEALSRAPYQTYGGERVSPFSGLQEQAFQRAETQEMAPQLGAATGLAGLASLQGLQAGRFQPGRFTPMGVQGPQLQQFQLGAPMGVGTQSFTQPGAAEQYMSPYMQQVVGIQQREAQRQADIAATERGAQAVRAGAFGGSRQAIMDAEAQRNLAQQMGDIQATGSQAAFQQAQDLFGREQQMGLQAQMANQQAGLTAGQANLQSLLQTQQLGAGQSMEAQRANQQALADAQRAFEQSRQFGADLGLRGGAQALQGAQTLGQLGQQQFGQEMDITGLQSRMGAEQQQREQQILDQQFADFQAQRDFPYQQLGFYSDLLRGAGGTSRSIYAQPQPSTLQTVAGLGTAAAGLGRMFAKGGEVQKYANGGITGLLDDQQLAQTAQSADQGPMMQLAAAEEAQRRDMIRSAVPADMPRETDMTEQELLAALQQAIREGNETKARVIAELIEERKMPESGIAAIASDDIGDMPEGGLIGMAMGGEVQRFQAGGMPRSPYQRRDMRNPSDLTEEEFQQRLLEEQEMQQGRGLMAAPTAQELMQAHRENPRMMAGLPALRQEEAPPPAGNVSTGGVDSPSGLMAMARQFGIDPEGAAARQRGLAEQQAEARERGLTDREAALEAFIQSRGVYGKEQEAEARQEIEALAGKKLDAKNFALIQAGLAILSADPSRGAFAAIGEGAAKGLMGYKGDLEKLDEKREKINARMDRILELRRLEETADGRDRLALKNERSKLEELAIQDTREIMGGLDKGKEGLGTTLLNIYSRQREAQLNREAREESMRNRSVADLAQMRISLDATIRRLESKTFLEPEEEIELQNARADRAEVMKRLAGRQGMELPSQRGIGGGTLTQADQDLINKYSTAP